MSIFCIIFSKAVSQKVIRQDVGERERDMIVCSSVRTEKKGSKILLKATPGSEKES